MSLFFHPEAKIEECEAILWYGKRGSALSRRLRDSLRAAYDRILRSPKRFLFAVAECRQAHIKTFPYLVFFLEFAGDIYIVVVAHTSREPNYWAHRRLQFSANTRLQ